MNRKQVNYYYETVYVQAPHNESINSKAFPEAECGHCQALAAPRQGFDANRSVVSAKVNFAEIANTRIR